MRLHKPWQMDAYGHLGVTLRSGGAIKSRYVHQLVLEAFVGPRPEGMVACHWNDISDDNRVENLRWATPQENRMDTIRNGHDPNATKNACKWGHPYDERNVRMRGSTRICRTCASRYEAEYRARRRAMRSKETA